MTRSKSGSRLRERLAVLPLMLLIAACGTGGSSGQSGSQKIYTVYLSNNFVGNDWRVLMENLAQVLKDKPPLKGRINLKVVNSDQNSPSSQIQSLNNMIAQKPDAIIIDASSPDALNATIKTACDKGITVVSFDQTVTAQCAWKVTLDWTEVGKVQAQWLVDTLKGSGNIFADQGIPGFPVSQTVIDAYTSVFSKYPNIKISCKFTSTAALGPEQSGVSNCMAANPNVSGVFSFGFGTGAMTAIKQAGHTNVPVAAQTYNASMIACADKSQPCLLVSDPAWISGLALRTVIDIKDGKISSSPADVPLPIPYFENNGVPLQGASTQPQNITLGQNAFPDLPGTVFLPFSPPWATVTPAEAQSGKAAS